MLTSIKGFKRYISAVVYTIFVFNTHPINRISKVGAAIVNAISSCTSDRECLLFKWSCICLVEDMMNTLDDCDLLEKVFNMTYVHEHNDFTVNKSTTIQVSLCSHFS